MTADNIDLIFLSREHEFDSRRVEGIYYDC